VTDLERLRLLDPGPPVDGASSSAGSPGFVGKVTSTGANLAVGKFFLATPTTILGAEVDGGAGTLAGGTGPIAVYALGPVAPAAGDYLVCRRVDYRWVAEKAGGTGGPSDLVTLPNCYCPVPKTLRMTSFDQTCNYSMFQSCTLQYGPPPAIFASLNITGDTFLSTTLFHDPISNADFYYHLYCNNNQFLLTRLYPSSPYGSPFRDGTLYNWLTGGGNCVGGVIRTNDCAAGTYRNPCWSTWSQCVSDQYASTHGGVHLAFDGSGNPIGIGGGPADVSGTEYAHCGARPAYQYTAPGFRLHNGQAFPGSDATCDVFIDPA